MKRDYKFLIIEIYVTLFDRNKINITQNNNLHEKNLASLPDS